MSSSSESSLSRWAKALTTIAIVSALLWVAVFLLGMALRKKDNMDNFDFEVILTTLIALAALTISCEFWAMLLRAGADVVRLLKKLNHLDFDGEIY